MNGGMPRKLIRKINKIKNLMLLKKLDLEIIKHPMSMKNKRLILIKYKAKESQQIFNRKKRFLKNFHAGTATNFTSKVKRHKNLTFS